MAKHAYGNRPHNAPYAPPKRGWEQTPKWHPRYWFGYRMRKWDVGRDGHALLQHPDYNSDWIYRTFGQHARAVLEEQSNVGTKQQDAHGVSGANYIVGASNLGAGRSTF